MLKKVKCLIAFLIINVVVLAQNDKVLFTIDGNKVYKNEFIRAIEGNNIIKQSNNSDSIEKLLNIFIGLKRKVIEAKSIGLNNSERYNTEIRLHRQQLLSQFLANKKTLDFYVQQTWERSRTEVWIKQILLRLDPDASAKDSLLVYQKALNIRKKLLSGSDFNLMASQMSEDPTASINSGDLWYVKPLSIPYQVEDYIYSNSIENISYPIRTELGYHLIEVKNKRPNQGRFKVAHILISNQPGKSDTSEVFLKQRADSIYNLAIKGADFNKLALEYSYDKGTSATGGELPWFETGQMPREFENASILLKSDGSISKPVKTKFGWHIIKKIAHEDYPSFDLAKQQYYNRVLNSDKGKLAIKKQIEILKKQYNFADYNNLDPFYSLTDSTIFEGNWQIPLFSDLNNILFSIQNNKYYQKDFAEYMQANQKKIIPIPILNYVNSRYSQFIDSAILSFETEKIEHDSPDFKFKMNYFSENALANYLMQIMVWDKPVDEKSILTYYNNNIKKYNKSLIADVCIFTYSPDKQSKIEKFYEKSKVYNFTLKELENTIQANIDNEFVMLECGKFEKGQNKTMDICFEIYEKGQISADQRLVFLENSNKLILLTDEIKKADLQSDDIKKIVISDYMDQLEYNYLQDLQKKYPVQIEQDVFESLIKK